MFLLLASTAALATLDCAALATDLAALEQPAARVSHVVDLVVVNAADAQAASALGRVLVGLQDPAMAADGPDALRARLLAACVKEPEVSQGPPAAMGSAPPATPAPALLREYERRHLERGTLSGTSVSMVPVSTSAGGAYMAPVTSSWTGWTVYDGGGAPLSALDFISRVDDPQGIVRLDGMVTRIRKRGVGLLIGGLVAGGIGTAALVAGDDEPGAGRILIGVVGLTGAIIGVPSGAAVTLATPMQRKNAVISRVYSPDEADALVERYNEQLRVELGVSGEDTSEIDLR